MKKVGWILALILFTACNNTGTETKTTDSTVSKDHTAVTTDTAKIIDTGKKDTMSRDTTSKQKTK